jgi:DNA-dependent metalloprotease WSS1
MAPRRGGALAPPEEMYGAQKMKVLTKMPRSDQAMDTMKRIADQVKPLCVKYKWTVRSFEEFFPDNNSLLGMNVNWGQKIFVRLRSGHDDFMLYERVLATMLHELTHMEHGNHSADFYRFLDALTDECDALIRKGIRGSNMPWQGEGKSLGGSNGAITAADPKAAAAAAAERRARAAGIMMGSGGQRIGGHGSCCGGSCSSGTAKPTPESLRKLRLSAAQRRLADNQTCVATQDGASCEYSSQHQHDSSSDNDDDAMSDSTSTAAAGDSSSDSNSSVLTQSQMVGDDSEPGSWACDRCTLINEAAATRCSVCGADYGNGSTNADSGSGSDDDCNTTTTSSSTAAAAAAASSKSKSKSTTRHPLSNSKNTDSTSSGSSSSSNACVKAAAASASTTVNASALRPDMPAQAARWRCDQCSFINSAFSERCTALGCRGEQQQTTPIPPTATTTTAAAVTNSSSSSGTTPTKQQQQQQQLFDSPLCATAAELSQWSCVVCTLVNRPLALVCECCDAIRDVSSTTSNSSSSAGSGAGTGSSASSSVQQQQQQQSALSRGKRKLNDAEGGDNQGEVVDMTGFD